MTAFPVLLGKMALHRILINSDLGSLYATSGPVVVLLLFIFYSAMIFFFFFWGLLYAGVRPA